MERKSGRADKSGAAGWVNCALRSAAAPPLRLFPLWPSPCASHQPRQCRQPLLAMEHTLTRGGAELLGLVALQLSPDDLLSLRTVSRALLVAVDGVALGSPTFPMRHLRLWLADSVAAASRKPWSVYWPDITTIWRCSGCEPVSYPNESTVGLLRAWRRGLTSGRYVADPGFTATEPVDLVTPALEFNYSALIGVLNDVQLYRQIETKLASAGLTLDLEKVMLYSAIVSPPGSPKGLQMRSPEATRVLFTHPAVINSRCSAGHTQLQFAAEHGYDFVATLMLSAGADPEVPGSDGSRPIHAAVAKHHDDMLRLLLSHGAAVDPRDGHARTPLHLAAFTAAPASTVRILLGAGADPDARDTLGYSPLHLAVVSGAADLVTLLLTRTRASLDSRSDALESALLLAVRFGRHAAATSLLAAGADAGLTDQHGLLPAHIAAMNSYEPLLRVLLDRSGAPVDARDVFGNTVLHYAVRARFLDHMRGTVRGDAVGLLLTRGADPRSKNVVGELAFS
ncbi:hypothetical protein HK405_010394 [Cladochytrium tenue]|nr:hypothetical protein HK405_010394 [Cladochytrium tenue]